MDVINSLKKLENWLQSWQREDGAYNGIIATFWESTLDTIQANSVHQAPIIRGYLNLYQKTDNRVFLQRAVKAADFLVSDMDWRHHYSHTASDVPGKLAGPIQDIECDLALIHLYKNHRDKIDDADKYLKAVISNVQNYLLTKWWNGRVLSNQVANQIAKNGELFLELYSITKQPDYLKYAISTGDWLVTNQIKSGPLQGALEQSFSDSRIILVYQVPCLPCLVKLHQATGQGKYLQAANLLTKFIKNNELAEGGFIGLYEQTLIIKLVNYLIRNTAALRFVLQPCKKHLLNSPLGRFLLVRRREPIFIARTAEILINLLIAEPTFNLQKHLDFILRYQLTSGSIQNWLGSTPTRGQTPWAPAVPVTRWNVFVFELLSSLLPEKTNYPEQLDILPSSHTSISQYGLMVENHDYFVLIKESQGYYSLSGIYKKGSSTPALNLATQAPKKNLLIVTPIFPPETGGCASRMSDFVQFLNKKKWNIHVFTNQTSKPLRATDPVPVKRIPLFVSFRQIHKLLITSWQLIHCIIKNKINIVLTTIPPGLHAALTIYIAKLLGRPVVLDVRDPWIMGEVYTGTITPGSWKYKAGKQLEKMMFTRADRITSVYQSVMREVINQYPINPNKIAWIPNGINPSLTETTDPTGEPRDPVLNNRTTFLYQGLMARPQNVDRVIDFIPQITKQVPNALFVFIGDGPDKEQLVQKAKAMALDNWVLFKNRVSREEVLQWIRRSNYGIVPLANEFSYAIPSKLFDYLIFRKPILAFVPPGGEADKLIEKYHLGINILRSEFHLPSPIQEDNPIFKDYSRKTTAQALNNLLRSLIG